MGDLVRLAADGSGTAEVLVKAQGQVGQSVASSWSADGRLLAFQLGQDVLVREAEGTLRPALGSGAFEREGRFSPNGRWMAYRSNESGRDEVYVQSYPPGGGKWQISTEGGAQPMWRDDGNELFYKSGVRRRSLWSSTLRSRLVYPGCSSRCRFPSERLATLPDTRSVPMASAFSSPRPTTAVPLKMRPSMSSWTGARRSTGGGGRGNTLSIDRLAI